MKGWSNYEKDESKGNFNVGWRLTLENKKEFGYIVIVHAKCTDVPTL